jgi:4-diphosphocytidyl-2-C-methyl-D-erythritol kinase
MYQTIGLHDEVTVAARRAGAVRLRLTTSSPYVPVDGRNTAWKMVERCLGRMGIGAEVAIHIEKRLPVQGGLGAGSANAVAALLGLERELGMALDGVERLELAAEVGSDVPLFLLGGSVLGLGRGEQVVPLPELPTMPCVVAVPGVRVSTPAAFREWDLKREKREEELTGGGDGGRIRKLSLAYASMSARNGVGPHSLGVLPEASFSEKQQGDGQAAARDLRFGELVGRGLVNDFEEVVFGQHPGLREVKRQLAGHEANGAAFYAALSGSGSALFGLYRSVEDAAAAQHRVQGIGVEALLTATLPRDDYWRTMFAG